MNLMSKIVICTMTLTPGIGSAGDVFTYPDKGAARFQHQLEFLETRKGTVFKTVKTVAAKPIKVQSVGNPTVAKRTLRGRHFALYITDAKQIAERHGIPEALFLALIQQESGWNKNARSGAGAIGLAQLMPGTAKYLRVNPHDPVQNLEGGARYLREQFDAFGDWRLALAAYNAGPGAVQKYSGIPPYRETQNYVKRILGG